MSFHSLINGDAVRRDNEVKTKEGINFTKRMDRPKFFKYFDNVMIGLYMFAQTEKIVGSTTDDDWVSIEDTRID